MRNSLFAIALLVNVNVNALAAPLDWCANNETRLPMPGSSIVAGYKKVVVQPRANTIHLTASGVINQSNTVYVLDKDISCDGTCFDVQASNITLDGGMHKIVYGAKDGMSYGVMTSAWNKTDIIVQNIEITQGAGMCSGDVNGKGCNPIGAVTSSFSKIAGVKLTYGSKDTAGIFNFYGDIVVQDSEIKDINPNGEGGITNRHQGTSSIHVPSTNSSKIFRNRLIEARHRGISVGNNAEVYQNVIGIHSVATNAAGVFVFGNVTNFKVYGNVITGRGQHPVGLFAGAGANNGVIYSNSVDTENTEKSTEYANTGSEGIRTTWGLDKTEIFCNTVFLHGGNYAGKLGIDPWYGGSSWGRALMLGLNNATQVVKVHHNQVEAQSDDNKSYVAALAIASNLPSTGLEVSDNILASNILPIGLGDNYGSMIGFGKILRNKVIKTGFAPSYANIKVIYGGQPIEAILEDNDFNVPLSPDNVKLDGCNSGNVEVRIKDKGQSYILSDSGIGVVFDPCIVKR